MKRSIFTLFFGVLCCLDCAQSQTIWTQRSERAMLRLEYLSPSFANAFPGFGFTSQIVTLTGRYPIGTSIVVVLEAPMAWESQSTPFGSTSQNGLGNMFLGLEIGSIESMVYGEIGARPILRQDLGASGIGGYLGDYDRGEAYFKEMTSYQFALNVASPRKDGFVYRVRVGPTFWVPEEGKKTTTFLDYGGKAGFDDGALSLYTGITGRWMTTTHTGKAVYHHLGFDLGYRFNTIRPALFVRFPLDKEINDIMNRTIGANVSVEL